MCIQQEALKYAKKICDSMIKTFEAADLPPKGGFHYHQGVFLSGMMNVYEECRDERYFNYIKNWVDSIVKEDGVIDRFFKGALDDYMAGILLFPLYDRTKEDKYKVALDLLLGILKNWVCNKKGGYWHKEYRPEQMWLDGLYMVGPLQAIYAKKTGKEVFLDRAIKQLELMYENMQDEDTKLLYHAWHCQDEVPMVEWADEKTGLSPEIWGRAMGWYVVAVLDILEQMDIKHPKYQKLCDIEKEILESVVNFQDCKTGMWYQVVDKGDRPDNWIETSCSCLFTYSLAKAIRFGIISKDYLENINQAFTGITKNYYKYEDNIAKLTGVCVGTGVCDYQGYIERPTSTNDLHGLGAFLLMCAELAKIN